MRFGQVGTAHTMRYEGDSGGVGPCSREVAFHQSLVFQRAGLMWVDTRSTKATGWPPAKKSLLTESADIGQPA